MRHEANGRALQSRLHKMHHPRRNALRLQSAPPSRRNCPLAAPGYTRRDYVTRPVTRYQATRISKEVSPYIRVTACSHPHCRLIPVPFQLKVWAVFPFIVGMWESGFWCPNSLFQFVSASWLFRGDNEVNNDGALYNGGRKIFVFENVYYLDYFPEVQKVISVINVHAFARIKQFQLYETLIQHVRNKNKSNFNIIFPGGFPGVF